MLRYFSWAAAALTAGGLAWAVADYRRWLALGKGGVPSNPAGWIKVTRWRLQKREAIGVEIYAPARGGPTDSVRLGDIPYRRGPRPKVDPHPVPHRQIDQPSNPVTRERQDKMFDTYVAEQGRYLRYGRSNYEKHNNAVFVQDVEAAPAIGKLSRGEVAHIHPTDGSMHMIFSPSDATTVITKGWGERHPLAGVRPALPDTYLLIYAPRDEVDLRVLQQLLKAAISHMCVCEVAAPSFHF